MKPTIVLVGRPNVGKSTLFNRMTRSRRALVADIPGLTRDRHYGHGQSGDRDFLVVDTGGFEPVAAEGIYREMARQTRQAVDEGDAVLLVVDARQGLTPMDRQIAAELRKSARRLWLVVNKAEGLSHEAAAAEFHELGLGEPLTVSAAHGDGVHELVDVVLEEFPARARDDAEAGGRPKIAVVGRPNVGKSTLVNALLGEERVIAFDQPGTTRDSIYVDFERGGRGYTLIDTAGLRRRGRMEDVAEKFSAVKTLQAVEDCNVAVLVLDVTQDISDQDAHLAGFILEAGRALVVAINKWDAAGAQAREKAKRDYARKLNFLDFAPVHFISARDGTGLPGLLASAQAAYAAAMARLSTPRLTRVMLAAVQKQSPPRGGTSRPKLRYAHQGGTNPPLILIHGNALDEVPDSYRRYLERAFMTAFQLRGTPVKVVFKQGHNPFAGGRRG
ncbi:MAG TPA: ribosome biogenesis GTPase Der [Burkholderiales bacterium]|nr:ribosome biogenesis GTPase Der [Burkholderiales bacterium]